jgi:hypothetical protein
LSVAVAVAVVFLVLAEQVVFLIPLSHFSQV